jgi:hypothetical protein
LPRGHRRRVARRLLRRRGWQARRGSHVDRDRCTMTQLSCGLVDPSFSTSRSCR